MPLSEIHCFTTSKPCAPGSSCVGSPSLVYPPSVAPPSHGNVLSLLHLGTESFPEACSKSFLLQALVRGARMQGGRSLPPRKRGSRQMTRRTCNNGGGRGACPGESRERGVTCPPLVRHGRQGRTPHMGVLEEPPHPPSPLSPPLKGVRPTQLTNTRLDGAITTHGKERK